MHFERSCFHTWLQKWAYGSGQSNCWIHKPQTDASATAVLARGLTSSHWKETDLRLPGSTTIHKRRVKPTQWNLEPKMVRNGDLMIFSVSLIKLYLKFGLFRGMRQKPSLFFAKPLWVGLLVSWKWKGSGPIQSLVRFVALNRLLYASALCK